ncbi:MAG: alpha/beta hydrolase [Blastocatellia bacterium]|nr:alpha/beta hydrolase [Blastocatellia bacterium]
MPHVRANDIDLYYEIHGEGPPLVLIPGFSAGLWIWYRQVPDFAKHFQTIIYNPRGVGTSGINSTPHSIKLYAEDVAGLITGLGLSKVHVLGTSMGGFIAQELALHFPQLVEKLVLTCTGFGGPGHVMPRPETLMAMASLSGLNSEERSRRNLLLAFTKEFLETAPSEVETVLRLRAETPISEMVYLSQLQAAATFDCAARVAGILAPTLVISGDEDEIVPTQNSRNLADRIPQATLEIMAGGHAFFMEQPEAYNQIVCEFLRS